MRHVAWILVLVLAPGAWAGFTLDDNGKNVTILEDGKPVLVYHYTFVAPPEGVDEHYRRLGYIHPLYALDGEELTQDFPRDHYHHRGVFWAWPDSTLGERKINVWLLDDVRQHHEKWLAKEAGAEGAVIAAQNAWIYDDQPDTPKVRETIQYVVHPLDEHGRAIDVTFTLENLSEEVLTLRGATTSNKGYGGFCLRPPAPRKPFTFTAANGVEPKDVLRLESPWADISFKPEEGSKDEAGVAIFQHPANPGYPHPGWIFRGYAFLGASWPHTEPTVMEPGDSFELRYRLLVHRRNAQQAEVSEAFAAYETGSRAGSVEQ